MGQTSAFDANRGMLATLPSLNVTEVSVCSKLQLYTCLEVPFFEKVFEFENYRKLEVTFKFFGDILVHLEINKEAPRAEKGCPVAFSNELVYGYKFKKNDKNDSIRPDKIFFKRKISPAVSPNSRPRHRKSTTSKQHSKNTASSSLRRNEKKELTINEGGNNREGLICKLAELKLLSKL